MSRWRIDWAGEGSPEAGQLVRYVTPKGTTSYARVLSVRVVMNRKPLPDGVTCRYAMRVQRLARRPIGELVSWTCHAHASRPKPRPRLEDAVGTNDLDAAIWAAPKEDAHE